MKKSKSLIKTSAAALCLMHVINKLIESKVSSQMKRKFGGKFYHWKLGDIFYTSSDARTLNKEDIFADDKKENIHLPQNPLLLIHDLTVFSSDYEWNLLVKELSKTHTVFTLDLIGCGKSDKPELTYTNYFYVQMINDFVNDVIGCPTKVVVTGLSSSFVIMANSVNKNLFTDITIISPKSVSSMNQMPDYSSKILTRLFHLPVIGKTAYYLITSKQNTEYYLTETCYHNPFHLKKSVMKAYYDAAHTLNGSGKMLLASIEGHYIDIDISKALKNAENNIVLIIGEHDDRKKELQSSYQKINPNISTWIVENAKLLPQLEAPNELMQVFMQIGLN